MHLFLSPATAANPDGSVPSATRPSPSPGRSTGRARHGWPRHSLPWRRRLVRHPIWFAAQLVIGVVAAVLTCTSTGPAATTPSAIPAPAAQVCAVPAPASGCRSAAITAPPPSGAAAPAVVAAGPVPGGSGCSVVDLSGCASDALTGFFRGLVTQALNPLLGLLSQTLLTTPTPDSLPAVAGLWSGSWQILLACYGLLILIAGIVVMAHETVQSRYAMKDVAPRIVVGFLAGAASLAIATQAVTLANALSLAIVGDAVDPIAAGATLRELIVDSVNHNFFLVFVALILVGMLCGLLIGWVIRVTLTVVLIAGAPIALMFHALPQTEGIAYGWWRAFGGCLVIQIVQSLTLITAMKVFLAPGGFTPFGATDNGLVDLLVAIALVWVLYRIPFWVLAAVRRGGVSRTLVGSLVRSVVIYRSFGLLTGRGHPHGGGWPSGGPGAPSARPGPHAGPTGGPGGGAGSAGPRPSGPTGPRPTGPGPRHPASSPASPAPTAGPHSGGGSARAAHPPPTSPPSAAVPAVQPPVGSSPPPRPGMPGPATVRPHRPPASSPGGARPPRPGHPPVAPIGFVAHRPAPPRVVPAPAAGPPPMPRPAPPAATPAVGQHRPPSPELPHRARRTPPPPPATPPSGGRRPRPRRS